uniref:Flavin-containing monooxygenase n=1 Tax=Rhodnius prolixus TaxID=13249 RepID=T1HWV6_RHOPR
MRICIIGFGAAGLAAARHVTTKHDCIVFEQTDRLGGTWVYTEEIGEDKFGLPIHTSMYKSLRTNLPKEVMGYPDFPIPEQEKSYLTAKEILGFLEQYAKNFDLLKFVKFNHHVRCVTPSGDEWKVQVRDLENNEDKTYTFDAVMVCNGHYHTPLYPTIPGLETFPGEKMHSHDYREPSIFKDKKVIVVGAGPSGIDLSLEIASTASKVILSRHKNSDDIKNVFPKNVEMKFEISSINGNNIIFEDGSIEETDTLFYCTGYKYSFPFLTEECGVKVDDNCVQPLYKHLIHIEHPTLCLIGLPYYVCAFALFDLQVRYFLKIMEGEVKLPSREEMLNDTKQEMLRRKASGLKKKQFHMMGVLQGDYYDELATLGNLPPLPPVMANLHNFASDRQLNDLKGFREDNYRIVDKKTFIKVN